MQTETDRPSAVDQLRFADPRNGYADGVGLWQTHDGGGHWTRERTVAGIKRAVVSDIVVSGETVYALVAGTDARYGGSDSHLRLATAAASSGTFHVLADLGTKTQADNLAASGGAVYFLDSRIGNNRGYLVRVHGNTLTRNRLPADACEHLAASTATAVLLTCGQGVAQGSMGNRMLYGSANSGHSFTHLPNPGRGAGYDGSDVADAGNGHAVVTTAGGSNAALRFTGNGARSWHTALQISHAQFSELGFEDTEHGVVIATIDGHQPAARLYRTSTAGSSWARVSFR